MGLVVVFNNIRIANSKVDLNLASLLKLFDLKYLFKDIMKREPFSPAVVGALNIYLIIALIAILLKLSSLV